MHRSPLVMSMLLLASTGLGRARADDAEEIRKLVPSAAAMSLEDFDRLATSATAPKDSDVEDKSLTLMALTLRVTADEDQKALGQFRFLNTDTPKPSTLAKELTRNVKRVAGLRIPLGPVTFIHADRITNFTCEIDGRKATGTVSFKVPELYQGKVDYVARRTDGKWQITEFLMPARGIYIVRGKDGKWRRKAQGSADEGPQTSEGN